jgi:hypothetical protein
VLLLATAAFAQKSNLDQGNNPGNDFVLNSTSSAPTQITEDFEGGTPPAGWSQVNNTGGPTIWCASDEPCCVGGSNPGPGNYTGGSGRAACSNNDATGPAEFDNELRTESYNFCNATNSEMNGRINYQNFGGLDFFEIDYSTDGGGGWTNVLSYNSDHPLGGLFVGPGEPLSVNISAVDGEPNVMFRFHYFDPNSADFDWYVQLDDYELAADGEITTPGVDACEGGPGGPVPAAGSLGIALVGLVLLAGGTTWVLIRRRRSTVA